jgi:hypothetical protein
MIRNFRLRISIVTVTVSKQAARKSDAERFNLKKSNVQDDN